MPGVSNIIPSKGPKTHSSTTVLVDGLPIPDSFGLSSIWILQTVNKIPTAKLTLIDGSAAEQKYEASNSNLFVPGKELVIRMGYDQLEETVFKGIIIKQRVKLLSSLGTQLIVEVKDSAVKMTVGRKNKYFFDKSDSEIIKNIVRDYSADGITANISEPNFGGGPSPGVVHKEMVQYFCTDWDFIVSRAEASGRLVMVKDGKINIATPDFLQQKAVNVSFGENVYEFDIEVDSRNEYKQVTARSWDNVERKVKSETVKTSAITPQGNLSADDLAQVIGLEDFPLQHSGDLENQELKAWAGSKFMRSRLAKIQGTAKVEGFSEIELGSIIGIENISRRFNGQAFVSGLMQQYSGDSAWFTDIQFGFCQDWFADEYNDIVQESAAGLLPSVNGLALGVVTDIDAQENDPENDYRVKVNMPLIEDSGNGVWARLSAIGAGQDKGVFFRPGIGDEVVLGFLDEDPRQPIILGGLYGVNKEKGTPPEDAKSDTDNFIKGIFTDTGLKLVFNEDENSITIQTKKEQKIVLSDEDDAITIEDSNKNVITMDSNGIQISSDKDISMVAKGKVSIEGKGIENTSKGSFVAKATGEAKLDSSGGNAIINGQLVLINS